tara:strand:- start:500 stop:724 length:225 start_codon:yes stop_codon:yes gene_type:complete
MVKIEFRGFLPQEDKPEKFEKFRQIASVIFKTLDGNLVFSWITALEQFDIAENNTKKSDIEIRNMLGNDSNYLV